MISRYTRSEMSAVWEPEARFDALLEVETAVAKAQAQMNLIPRKAAAAIARKGKFSVERIDEIEKITKHDVIAFVSNVAENVGEYGRFVHFGMTSSDVLDTAHSLLVRKAFKVLDKSLDRYGDALKTLAQKHKGTLCAGRTHGMHAEPTTFGHKMAGHYAEFQRARRRLEQAVDSASICKLSGPVGTYSTQDERVEKKVADILKLRTETLATQVIPRDRYAGIVVAIAFLGAALERLAVELRHLQRTEMGEVMEGFSKGQKGSSAMPHKRNPIGSENLTGAARILRSYVAPSLENISLWHERDISHSSVERVMFPDMFILADYAFDRMAGILSSLEVRADRMKENMALSQGQLFSSQVLLALVDKGLSREAAYALVQSVSHSLGKNDNLLKAFERNKDVRKMLKPKDLRDIFAGKRLIRLFEKGVIRALRYKGD